MKRRLLIQVLERPPPTAAGQQYARSSRQAGSTIIAWALKAMPRRTKHTSSRGMTPLYALRPVVRFREALILAFVGRSVRVPWFLDFEEVEVFYSGAHPSVDEPNTIDPRRYDRITCSSIQGVVDGKFPRIFREASGNFKVTNSVRGCIVVRRFGTVFCFCF